MITVESLSIEEISIRKLGLALGILRSFDQAPTEAERRRILDCVERQNAPADQRRTLGEIAAKVRV